MNQDNSYVGILNYTLTNIGSRSEGYFSTLECCDGQTYTLYRPNNLEVNDVYFACFNGHEVVVTGVVSNECWLEVQSIEIIDKEVENLNNENLDEEVY